MAEGGAEAATAAAMSAADSIGWEVQEEPPGGVPSHSSLSNLSRRWAREDDGAGASPSAASYEAARRRRRYARSASPSRAHSPSSATSSEAQQGKRARQL